MIPSLGLVNRVYPLVKWASLPWNEEETKPSMSCKTSSTCRVAQLNVKLSLKIELLLMQVKEISQTLNDHETQVEHLNGQPLKLVLLFSDLQLLVAGRVAAGWITQTHHHLNLINSDHVGFGPDRQTTAAVGILKCVRCEENHDYNRISKVASEIGKRKVFWTNPFKDTICFAASSFYYLVEKMQMDLHEPPMSQVNWTSS